MESASLAMTMAQRYWNNLDSYEGFIMSCGLAKEDFKVPWFHYDMLTSINPPALNQRFRRGLFVDGSADMFWLERFKMLKVMKFYLGPISQAIVIITSPNTTTENIVEQCEKVGFDSAKRIHEQCVLVHKI